MTGEFKKTCKAINDKCVASIGGEREFVTERTALVATYIVKYLVIEQSGDLLLYCAAMNVLNTFVKQKDNKISYGYFFKKYADTIAEYMLYHAINGIDVEIQKDKGMPYMLINLFGLQCSFHGVTTTDNIKQIKTRNGHVGFKSIVFDGIKKQMCANTLFDIAMSNAELRTNKTVEGNDLENELHKILNDYDEGKTSLLELKYA